MYTRYPPQSLCAASWTKFRIGKKCNLYVSESNITLDIFLHFSLADFL